MLCVLGHKGFGKFLALFLTADRIHGFPEVNHNLSDMNRMEYELYPFCRWLLVLNIYIPYRDLIVYNIIVNIQYRQGELYNTVEIKSINVSIFMSLLTLPEGQGAFSQVADSVRAGQRAPPSSSSSIIFLLLTLCPKPHCESHGPYLPHSLTRQSII